MTRNEESRAAQPCDVRAARELAAHMQTKRNSMRFPVYITQRLYDTDLEVLELSVRASNGLRRTGYTSVGMLMDAIDCTADLKKIRGMGEKTAQEIMYKLYLYQYQVLKPERQQRFLMEVMKLNGIITN